MNIMQKVIDANRAAVYKIFKHRCAVNPSHIATVIHEIEPRSIRPADWWELDNMIPLCANCHMQIHSEGTKAWRKRLEELRGHIQ